MSKCNYCAFYSLPGCEESVKQDYTDALIRQIKAFKTDEAISSVYFGGGTPPMIGVNSLLSVFETVKSQFRLSDNCEITVEVNPGSIQPEKLVLLRETGFNRLSIGMQSANDKELEILGRRYTSRQFKHIMSSAEEAGFKNRSADIMFGIPGQTKESLLESLQFAIDSGAVHISIYNLTIEEDTPFFRLKDKLDLPDEDTENEMYYLICDTMRKAGFTHYEISNYSIAGFESRHNLHYWDCGRYIGFGAAAHSYYDGKRFSNIDDIKKYIALSSDDFYSPTDFKEQPYLTEEEMREEYILLGLRTSKGIKADEKLLEKSRKYIDNGFAQVTDGYLSLTDKGYRISNYIISDLI
jgi:oxygen-independent coproporphyrinogen-3 oxidase